MRITRTFREKTTMKPSLHREAEIQNPIELERITHAEVPDGVTERSEERNLRVMFSD